MVPENFRGCCIPEEELRGPDPCTIRIPENKKIPVGVCVDPREVGDRRVNGEATRFYQTRAQAPTYKRNRNKCGIEPECVANTTYQKDYMYRGKDTRKCRIFEFFTDKNKCKFCHCEKERNVEEEMKNKVWAGLQQKPFYGRILTDLKPAKRPIKPDERQLTGTEYMDSISRIGGQIIRLNLHGRVFKQTKKSFK